MVHERKMRGDYFFQTPIWIEEKPEFVKPLNKASNKYIKEARTRDKKDIKANKDFGTSHHSAPLIFDKDFKDLREYIGQKSWNFLDWQGFKMESYVNLWSEFWVQEFSKDGGGHHSAHQHWNQHVSGFYFLKCSDKTSYPIFHDPRAGARMTKLELKDGNNISLGSELVHFKVRPGTLIIFPGYLVHEYAVDHGKEPFRFIHWNIQAVPKTMAKDKFLKL